jgi:hypothetical protein
MRPIHHVALAALFLLAAIWFGWLLKVCYTITHS